MDLLDRLKNGKCHVLVTEKDTADFSISHGALAWETYLDKSGLLETYRRSTRFVSHGNFVVCKLVTIYANEITNALEEEKNEKFRSKSS